MITDDARTATVTAVTSLRCYEIAFWDFRKFAKENSDFAWTLLQKLAALLIAEREPHARASARLPYSGVASVLHARTHESARLTPGLCQRPPRGPLG